MTGDEIVAYPNTLTGSIGVFFGKADLHGLYSKIGVTETTITRGRFADIDTSARPLSDVERAKLRHEIDVFYRSFVERVSAGRKRPYDQIEPLAQGHVWVGTLAKQNGLVDNLGGLDRAVELIKQKAKLPASEKISLVTYPPRRTLWELLLTRSDDTAQLESLVQAKTRMLVGNLPIRSLTQGGILRLMPYTIQVR